MSSTGVNDRPLVLVVPNFSEGRRPEVVEAIVAALQVPGALLLYRQADPDHNRLDTTLIGSPDAVRRAALAGARRAVELIDMEAHAGGHPRMGAVDVIPFVPVQGIDMDGCVDLARSFGRELAEELDLPVYLYERAALVPERASLAEVRRGEFEGLRADVAEGRRLPDFGPRRIGRAGATAVGARAPLVAFNVYLSGGDEAAAKAVARAVRETSGGLRNVRAIGFPVPERACVTVSMNLVDPAATPIHRALELVRMEAARYGMAVLDTEIVGLVPQAAIADVAMHYLQLRGFDPDRQILERLVARAANERPSEGGEAAAAGEAGGSFGAMSLERFVATLASESPTPGGGSVAAVAGSAGAALVAMVGRLTVGKKGYEESWDRMRGLVEEADAARAGLLSMADRDAEAFDQVMEAFRLPKDSDEQKADRGAAIQRALAGAAEVPLGVARLAAGLAAAAVEAVERGNANAASDGLAAAAMLRAAVDIALANVEINLSSLKDTARADAMREEGGRLRARADAAAAAAEAAFRGRLAG